MSEGFYGRAAMALANAIVSQMLKTVTAQKIYYTLYNTYS